MANATITHSSDTTVAPKASRLWAGRVMSAVPAALLLLSASMKLSHAPQFVAQWTEKFGWQEGSLTAIGLLELACLAVYLVPRTAFIGAILLSGYLGGAVATHVRIGDPFVVPIVLGVLAWGGLALRDARIWALAFERKDRNLPLMPR